MCRLYGFRSSVPRKVECELIHAQNSLLSQSRQDERGSSSPDGWGLGTYNGPRPSVVRQPAAAYDSAAFRSESARIYSSNTVAHVRRATVGIVREENTHPFAAGNWLFVHNGNLGAFEGIRELFLEEMNPAHRRELRGDTDSEHFFRWVLSRREREPDAGLLSVLGAAVHTVRRWSDKVDPGSEVTLNTILTDGRETVGTRVGRSLWYVERELVHPCEICDCVPHVEAGMTSSYRAVVVASERITTTEDWTAVPDESLFRIDSELGLSLTAL